MALAALLCRAALGAAPNVAGAPWCGCGASPSPDLPMELRSCWAIIAAGACALGSPPVFSELEAGLLVSVPAGMDRRSASGDDGPASLEEEGPEGGVSSGDEVTPSTLADARLAPPRSARN